MTSSSPNPSTAARRAIFEALRGGTATPALPPPSLAAFYASPFGEGGPGGAVQRVPPAELVDRFCQAAHGWRAEVLHASPDDWPQAVAQALARHGCQRLALGADHGQQLPGLAAALAGCTLRVFGRGSGSSDNPSDWKPALFDQIDAGITRAVAGVADTGSLLLRPGPGEPRSLSLVPPLHLAVLSARKLVPTLAAALAGATDLPTNVLLVTGPSKTADIQQVLAFGAHGPKALVIVLINDLPAAEDLAP